MQFLEITWWELISLLGLVQSVWLLVYMTLRAGQIRHASIALACFLCLSLAFLGDFGTRYLDEIAVYPLLQDLVWYALPAFSVLLAIQIAKINGLPEPKWWGILLAIPGIAMLSWVLGSFHGDCDLMSACDMAERRDILGIVAITFGAATLLTLWSQRGLLDNLVKEKSYRSDRYWLILALLVINCALLCVTLSFVSGLIQEHELLLIRNVLGCGLVYLASTSLFRIYPQTLKVTPKLPSEFKIEDSDILKKLEDLLTLQKVYQEPGYSRGDMARELDTSESVVTRIVNVHFGKSVPQLLNERRIADACLLLRETTAPVSVLSEQVGFNSVASFNRVFKEIKGCSPTEYREVKSPELKRNV